MQNVPPYIYSALPAREKMTLPGGARVAIWFGLGLEYFELGRPSTSIFPGTAPLNPDPLNYGWRDYGYRSGIWRMMDLFDRVGARASAFVNSSFCAGYPEIIRAGRQRNWAWVAHGRDMTFHTGMTPEQERPLLAAVVTDIERAVGSQPMGWLGPGLTETYATPDLLAELGMCYICDWPNDDQPFPIRTSAGSPMISVPYSVEINDMPMAYNGISGEDIYRMIVDSFDVLYAEGVHSARVLGMGLHPFVMGVPWRFKHFERAVEYIAGHSNVWLTTSDEVAGWYIDNYLDRDNAAQG